MRSILIINPSAGQLVTDLFGMKSSQFNRNIEQITPDSADETAAIVADIARYKTYDVIYISGGDGTINTVATAILNATPNATASERPAIGIVPAGTCNVLAGELGINDITFRSLVGPKAKLAKRTLDIGYAGGSYFLLMAGYGIDGEAVRNVSRPVKDILGSAAYAISALSAMASHKPSRATLTIDSETITLETSLVLIANAQSYGFNLIKIAPDASLDDGWLDVCVFEPTALQPTNILTHVARAVSSKHLDHPDVRYFRGKRITIIADPVMPGQLDGDASGSTPVTATVVPAALEFLVPSTRA